MTPFVAALGRAAAALSAAALAGFGAAAGLLPRDAPGAERFGWASAVALLLLAGFVPPALALGVAPGWPAFAALALVAAGAGLRFRVPASGTRPPGSGRGRIGPAAAAAVLLAGLGVALYALRALTEPMWSNDFVAIWGLKGKTLFLARGLPARFFASPDLRFSHPEYPLGLPLAYAGVSFLAGGWDDHALALLFPLLQVATVLALSGWLRRRGATAAVAWGAAALVALCEPLYSAFLTGLAEVPLALAALLFACALADALDAFDRGAVRRVAVAATLLAALKNEGLFLAGAGAAIAWASGKPGRRAALAALLPAAIVRAAHLPWRSRLPLADFDLSAASFSRVGEALAAAARVPTPAAWAALFAVAILVACGTRDPAGDRILLLALLALAAYLLIPAAAVRGPAWLVQTTLGRTAAALVPLAAAGVARRLGRVVLRPAG